MKKIFLLFLVLTFSCGQSMYTEAYRYTGTDTTGNTTDTSTASLISQFNTIWTSTTYNVTVNPAQKRAIANIFGYNTAHFSKVDKTYSYGEDSYTGSTNCPWGFMSEYASSGSCYTSTDTFRNYFEYNDVKFIDGVIAASPSPRDIGTINSIKVTLGLNVSEYVPDEIETDKAYLGLVVDTTAETFSLYIGGSSQTKTVSINGTSLKIKFEDGCGVIELDAVATDTTFKTINITTIRYFNNASSYKNASCYYNGETPSLFYQLKTIPNKIPSGVDEVSGLGLLFSFVQNLYPLSMEE